MARMQDKVAVITGGNSGIGLETAKRFVAEGARVAIFGRNKEALDAAAAELGDGALAIQGDVTEPDDLKALFEKTANELGKIDALFVNAGIAVPMPFVEADAAHFDQHFDINVKGAYFTVQAAVPFLNRGASVVLTTSSLDVRSMPGMSAYAATKAAVRSLARSASLELKSEGIRVNTVAPGPIATPIYDRMELPEQDKQAVHEQLTAQVPLGRFGEPREVADAVLFLASEESSFMLGAEVAVDGGFSQL